MYLTSNACQVNDRIIIRIAYYDGELHDWVNKIRRGSEEARRVQRCRWGGELIGVMQVVDRKNTRVVSRTRLCSGAASLQSSRPLQLSLQ